MHLLYLSIPAGGLDTNVRVLAPALAQAGHRVSVLYVHYPRQSAPVAAQGIEGCQVFHATTGNWHYYFHRATFGPSLSVLIRALEYARTMGRMVSHIAKKTRIDLVELPEIFAPRHLFSEIPFAVRLHSSAWMWRRMCEEPVPWTDRVEARWERDALRRACGISSPSRAVAEWIGAVCAIDPRIIEIVPYPIETNQFVPGARANPPVILFVGRVEKRKGADMLLRAIPAVQKKYPACEFVFAGSVSDELQREVASMPTHMKFLGARPRGELIQWYQRAAIFVAPSLWDNSPNTIYEAMACGTPVVATRVGGIPELVEDGLTGLLVPPRDADALADALLALLNDPAWRARMGQRAREKAVAEYAVEKIAKQMLNWYTRVLPNAG